MAIKAVLRMGDFRLYLPAKPVLNFNTTELQELIQDLYDTMAHHQGAGIAAPQIGVGVRLVIFGAKTPRYANCDEVPETILINPEITVLDTRTEDAWEGCLSVPGIRALVPRPRHIFYCGYDEKGKRIEREASGFHARVVMHEVDHLDGILFPMRVKNMAYLACEAESGQNHILKTVASEA